MPAEPNARDAKLIQYLVEAYGNEKRLETALEAHIAMTTRAPYKKRLREHLTETKRHAREVERRIKQLGGKAEVADLPGPGTITDAAGAVISGAQKAAALAQGPLHMLRGTGEEEKQLKNAKTEFAEEWQEIGQYNAIQTLAEKVGDRDTTKLAKTILRDEQRMANFLEKEIARLANAVATAEIPAALRNGASRGRASSASASSASSRRSSSRAGSSGRGSGSGRSASGRSASATARRATTTAKAGAKGAKAGAKAGAKGARAAAKRSTTAAKRTTTAARRSG